jgi:hypothetical protein
MFPYLTELSIFVRPGKEPVEICKEQAIICHPKLYGNSFIVDIL